MILSPGALPAAAARASFPSPALGWRLAAVDNVVVVEHRVRQVVELASLVVGEALVLTLEGVREEGDAAHAEPGGGGRRRPTAALGRSIPVRSTTKYL